MNHIISDAQCLRWIAAQVKRECPEEYGAMEQQVRIVKCRWYQEERAVRLNRLMQNAFAESERQRVYGDAVRQESRQVRAVRVKRAA